MNFGYYTIDETVGFQLLKTSWDILTHTCFVFQPLNITISVCKMFNISCTFKYNFIHTTTKKSFLEHNRPTTYIPGGQRPHTEIGPVDHAVAV